MPSRLYVAGLMSVLTCVESADVVERIINEAKTDPEHDSEYVDLTHMAEVITPEIPPGQDENSPYRIAGDPHDSFATLKVKYEYVQAIRDFHDKETP